METVIYADVLFFINFILDGLCVAVTAVLQRRKVVRWRFILAAGVGGVYSVGAVALNERHPLFTVLIHIAAAFIICTVAVKPKSFASAIGDTVCFFFVNAVLGGMLYAVYTLCGGIALYNGVFYADVSPLGLIALGVIALTVALFCITKAKNERGVKCCDLKLGFRGKECVLNCIYDSGNLLVCPYTALPVAIISLDAARRLFSDEELKELTRTPAIKGVRPLPAHGIGGTVMLPSFIPDKAAIRSFGDRLFADRQLCVAIKADSNGFGKTDGIVPLSLV